MFFDKKKRLKNVKSLIVCLVRKTLRRMYKLIQFHSISEPPHITCHFYFRELKRRHSTTSRKLSAKRDVWKWTWVLNKTSTASLFIMSLMLLPPPMAHPYLHYHFWIPSIPYTSVNHFKTVKVSRVRPIRFMGFYVHVKWGWLSKSQQIASCKIFETNMKDVEINRKIPDCMAKTKKI